MAWPRICGSRSYSWASRTKRLPLLAQPNTGTINELLEDYLVPECGTGGSPQRVMAYAWTSPTGCAKASTPPEVPRREAFVVTGHHE